MSSGHVDRRTIIAAAGAGAAAGVLAPVIPAQAARAQTAEDVPTLDGLVWSVAFGRNGYIALTGSIDRVQLRDLDIDSDGYARLRAARDTALPEGFTPSTIHGSGDRLLVAGSRTVEIDRLLVDNRSETVPPEDRGWLGPSEQPNAVFELPIFAERPAVLEVTSGAAREIPLGDAGSVPWGVATAVASVAPGEIAVAIEWSDDPAAAYNASVRVAESHDGGRTWTATEVATELGEGFPTRLVATADALVAIIVAGDGTRTVRQRRVVPPEPWDVGFAGPQHGPVLAAVAATDGEIDLFDVSHVEAAGSLQHEVYRTRLRLGDQTSTERSLVRLPDLAVETVLAVNGARGRWVAIGDRTARVIG